MNFHPSFFAKKYTLISFPKRGKMVKQKNNLAKKQTMYFGSSLEKEFYMSDTLALVADLIFNTNLINY